MGTRFAYYFCTPKLRFSILSCVNAFCVLLAYLTHAILAGAAGTRFALKVCDLAARAAGGQFPYTLVLTPGDRFERNSCGRRLFRPDDSIIPRGNGNPMSEI